MVRIACISQVRYSAGASACPVDMRDAQLSTAPNPVARVVHVLQQRRTSLGNQVAP